MASGRYLDRGDGRTHYYDRNRAGACPLQCSGLSGVWKHLIKEEVLDEGGEPAFHGYTVEYCHGEVYLSTGGEDSAQEVYLPKRFLARMGEALKNAEIPFLEVGVAFLLR